MLAHLFSRLKERKTFFASLPYVGFIIVAIDFWRKKVTNVR